MCFNHERKQNVHLSCIRLQYCSKKLQSQIFPTFRNFGETSLKNLLDRQNTDAFCILQVARKIKCEVPQRFLKTNLRIHNYEEADVDAISFSNKNFKLIKSKDTSKLSMQIQNHSPYPVEQLDKEKKASHSCCYQKH